MNEELVLATQSDVRLGSLPISGPAEVIARSVVIAKDLAAIINDRKLYTVISGRKFVRVEGWTTLGAMLGIVPREVSVKESENGDFEAVVELVRVFDGAVIGRGSALCGADEKTWGNRDRYARRSMAITRACGKAFRLCLSWIVTLAGYEGTPAEEMPDDEPAHRSPAAVIEQPKASAPKPAEKPPAGNGSHKPHTPSEGHNDTTSTRGVGKSATVRSGGFNAAAVDLAARLPYYQNKQGGADFYHLTGAAAKLGHAEITDENLAQVLRELEDYAAQAVKAAA